MSESTCFQGLSPRHETWMPLSTPGDNDVLYCCGTTCCNATSKGRSEPKPETISGDDPGGKLPLSADVRGIASMPGTFCAGICGSQRTELPCGIIEESGEAEGDAAGADATGAFHSNPASVGEAPASKAAKKPAAKIVFRLKFISAIVTDPAHCRISQLK